ncbi:MAG: SAM-dependent methyltransferase [Verrucomicrobiales bacterium]|jgi:SAM-dependent methyltransferase
MGATFRQVDLYDHPHYYDVIFDDGSAEEADFLEAVHREYGPSKGRKGVLEPACGTGRLIIEMAKRGYPAHGFDASAPMLEYARKRAGQEGVQLRLTEQRMEDFKLASLVPLAFSLISSFKYLLTEALALAHLRCISEVLVEGGVFVLGLHLTDYARDHPVHERWVVERDGVEVVCNTRSWPADRRRRRERVRNRLTVTDAKDIKRHESSWEFRTYSAAQLRQLLKKVPELERVAAFDFSYDLNDPRALDDSQEDIALVLRKRSI